MNINHTSGFSSTSDDDDTDQILKGWLPHRNTSLRAKPDQRFGQRWRASSHASSNSIIFKMMKMIENRRIWSIINATRTTTFENKIVRKQCPLNVLKLPKLRKRKRNRRKVVEIYLFFPTRYTSFDPHMSTTSLHPQGFSHTGKATSKTLISKKELC